MQHDTYLTAALCAASISLGAATTAAAQESADYDVGDLSEQTLRFGHNAPAESPSGRAAEELAALVDEKSNGKLTVEVFPANQLGNNRDLVEQTALGSLAMSMQGVGILGNIDPVFSLMQVPFLFESQEAIHSVLEGDIGDRLAEGIREERDIRLLSQTWDRLPRQICSAEPVRTPQDLKGVLIRSGSKGATAAFDLLGAEPTSVPLNEVYLALQNNVVSAVDLPADYFFNLSLYEVCGNLDMLNHTYGTQYVGINEGIYSDLAPAYQTILQDAVDEAGAYNNQLASDLESDYVDRLQRNGMTVIRLSEEEQAAFSEIIHDNIGEIEATWPEAKGLGQEILAMQDETN